MADEEPDELFQAIPDAVAPNRNYLRAWRERSGLTQEGLGEKIGTTGAVISLLETGDRALSPKWLRKLAPVLETTPGLLLDHHPDDLQSDLISAAEAVPKDRRAEVIQLLKIIGGGRR